MKHPLTLRASRRELATNLAALRFHQAENLSPPAKGSAPVIADAHIADIASDGGTLTPLSATEIDLLCRRLNRAQPPKGG